MDPRLIIAVYQEVNVKGCPRNENTLLIVTQIKLSMTFLYTSYREDHNSSVLKLLNSVGLCQKLYLNQDI